MCELQTAVLGRQKSPLQQSKLSTDQNRAAEVAIKSVMLVGVPTARTTYPDLGDVPKQPRKPASCKNCGVVGHHRNNFTKAMELRLAGGV